MAIWIKQHPLTYTPFTLKMMMQIYAEVFEQLQHVTRMNSNGQSYVLDTGHENLRKRIIHALNALDFCY
jgi:hypothetical protein